MRASRGGLRAFRLEPGRAGASRGPEPVGRQRLRSRDAAAWGRRAGPHRLGGRAPSRRRPRTGRRAAPGQPDPRAGARPRRATAGASRSCAGLSAAAVSLLGERLVAVHAALARADLPHAFGGAIALAYCTQEPRGTRDVDVNVFADVSRADEVLAALSSGVLVTDAHRATARRDGQARVWWDDTPIDVFLDTHAFHTEAAAGVRWVPFADGVIPVLGCEARSPPSRPCTTARRTGPISRRWSRRERSTRGRRRSPWRDWPEVTIPRWPGSAGWSAPERYCGCSTDRTLPVGSVNQAIGGPSPRMIPRSSCGASA